MTDLQVRNWFSKCNSSYTAVGNKLKPEDSLDFDQDALKELVESNSHKSSQNIFLYNLLPLEKRREKWVCRELGLPYTLDVKYYKIAYPFKAEK